MSIYAYNTLTADGAALIAQATAANPIVMVGSLSKATAASSAADLAVKDKSWYDGKSGAIAAASATASRARIVAVYRNAGTRQAAKAICITARLASQTDSDAVILCAMSDPDATVELPGADDTGQGVEIPFNIAINAADTIQATPGASASLADLERFVSTHAAGNPTQGEQQHIYGWKIFHNDVSVYSDLSAHVITSRRNGGGPLLTIDPDDGDYGTFNTTMRVNFNAFTITDYTTGDVCVSIDRTDTSQDADLTVNVPANFTAGITGNVIGNVTGNLTGLIPRPDVGTTSAPPIGSIFLAHLTAISGTIPMDVGMSVNTNTYNIRRAKFTVDSDGSVKAGAESLIGSIGTGTYTLMSGINGLNSGDSTVALVMRTA